MPRIIFEFLPSKQYKLCFNPPLVRGERIKTDIVHGDFDFLLGYTRQYIGVYNQRDEVLDVELIGLGTEQALGALTVFNEYGTQVGVDMRYTVK